MAVLINKAMIEIPPRFAGMPSVHPDIDKTLTTWERAQGLAADVEAYGRWMLEEVQRRVGHIYPAVTGPDGEELAPIAWIWARTVASPDPSWPGHVPLVASWTLSTRPGKPKVWIEPVIDRDTLSISYEIREGGEPSQERTVERGNGRCIATGAAIPAAYIKSAGVSGRMGSQLIAIVAKGSRGKRYCPPAVDAMDASLCDLPVVRPSGAMSDHPQYMGTPRYGIDEWWKLFTARQLVALTTFSDLLATVRDRVRADASAAGMAADATPLRDGGTGACAYADAIVTYLSLAVDRLADRNSNLCSWDSSRQHARNVFARQAIPMAWNFTENNPIGSSSGSWSNCVSGVARAIEHLPASLQGEAIQGDARARVLASVGAVVSTDPPYYDNVPYADISDFFYVWMRKNLSRVWPHEFSTITTPKAEELVADNYRIGSKHRGRGVLRVGNG